MAGPTTPRRRALWVVGGLLALLVIGGGFCTSHMTIQVTGMGATVAPGSAVTASADHAGVAARSPAAGAPGAAPAVAPASTEAPAPPVAPDERLLADARANVAAAMAGEVAGLYQAVMGRGPSDGTDRAHQFQEMVDALPFMDKISGILAMDGYLAPGAVAPDAPSARVFWLMADEKRRVIEELSGKIPPTRAKELAGPMSVGLSVSFSF